MGTTADKLQAIIDSKAAIKDAIEAKGVAVGDASLAQYASKIEAIEQGGGEVVEEALENDVNFYDYTGFRVASFSIEEAKALTQEQYDAILPPTHEGLTFQEWNWTLEDIQTYDRQYADIGANYITTDGKTHLKIRADFNDVCITLRGSKSSISIDWGDGSTQDSYSYPDYNTNANFPHVYKAKGIYDITISVTQTAAGGYCGICNMQIVNNTGWRNITIIEILIGNYFDFYNQGSLTNINKTEATLSIPAITDIEKITCPNLFVACLVVPRSSNYVIGYQHFYGFVGKVVFPRKIANMGGQNYLFMSCSFYKLVLPQCKNGTQIAVNAFSGTFNASIISLQADAEFASLASGQYFPTNRLSYLDIAQGWIPNVSMTLSQSTYWSEQSIVSFFNKLGATTDAITLTFGATNLNKLTEEEKAIATNKGYTLA